MALDRLRLIAPAKLNLTLEVLGRRPDGYHEIVSVAQTLALHDHLLIEQAADLEVVCPAVPGPPEENLVWRAARRLQTATGCRLGARIVVEKRIPLAAGLGGGSSDAAATLVGLNRLWGLGLSLAELLTLAADLGADVPFFLQGGTALLTGTGATVRQLPPAPPFWVVLVRPPVDLAAKTRQVYGWLTPADYTDGETTRRLVAALTAGQGIEPENVVNVFTPVVERRLPVVATVRAALRAAGAPVVQVAGSGPTVFALVASAEAAFRLAQGLAGWVRVTASRAWAAGEGV